MWLSRSAIRWVTSERLRSIHPRTRTIQAGSAIGIAAFLVVEAGCRCAQDTAPALSVPNRPVLQELSSDEWRTVPPEIRAKLSSNLSLIYQHVARLELTIEEYEAWRIGK